MGAKKSDKKARKLHPRNKHQGRYDFDQLLKAEPTLEPLIKPNIKGEKSIDFADPKSVKLLNKALLLSQYQLDYWDIPEGYLCPPIPGRADYIHHMADWLCSHNFGNFPTGPHIKCLDIGVGSSLIYPIIGVQEYGWSFIGSDIDPVSLKSAREIIEGNPSLVGKVELRPQANPKDILYGILDKEEQIDLSICNPPFHTSAEEAAKGSLRKVKNLTGQPKPKATLNFAGQPNELWYEGGERQFIRSYIRESKKFGINCFWYSTLVSKQTHLKGIQKALEEANATQVHTIPMGQGNKSSQIVTWTFLDKAQQKEWKLSRWKKNE